MNNKNKIVNIGYQFYNNNWINLIVTIKYLHLHLLWIIKMKIIMGIIIIR